MSTLPLGSAPATGSSVPLVPLDAQQQQLNFNHVTHARPATDVAEGRAEQGRGTRETVHSHHKHHVVVASRPMTHKYVLRRPRALQYYHEGNLVEPYSHEGEEHKGVILPLSYRDRAQTHMIPLPKGSNADSRSTDKPVVQRSSCEMMMPTAEY